MVSITVSSGNSDTMSSLPDHNYQYYVHEVLHSPLAQPIREPPTNIGYGLLDSLERVWAVLNLLQKF